MDPRKVANDIDEAADAASAAQVSANGKNHVFYDAGVPGVTANLAGDIWFQYGTGTTENQIIAQYVGLGGTSWQSVTMNNAVIATLDVGKLTAGTINVAIELTSATVTGGTLRTASSGQRVEISEYYTDRIRFFNADGTVAQVFAGSNYLQLDSPTGYTYGAQIMLEASNSAGMARVRIPYGGLTVVGAIKPFTDWVSGTSDDGIFCQDNYDATKRCKIYYNSSNQHFGVYDDAGNPHYITLSA